MKEINQAILKRFLKIAGSQLVGDWVILGGSVLPLLGIEKRVTLDIDLAAKSKIGNKEQMKLFEIAESLDLPVEAINTAAGYFLHKIKGWEDCLVLLYEGKKCRFYRPSASLFIQLKITRLSESDYSDCLEMIRFAKKANEDISQKVEREVKRLLSNSSGELKSRQEGILKALAKI